MTYKPGDRVQTVVSRGGWPEGSLGTVERVGNGLVRVVMDDSWDHRKYTNWYSYRWKPVETIVDECADFFV